MKNISEQTPSYVQDDISKLKLANEKGCYPLWLKSGTTGNYEGKKVWYGVNSYGNTTVFFADMTAQTIKKDGTIVKGKWNCDVLSQTAGVKQKTTTLTPDQQAMGATITADDEGWTNTKFSDYDTYPEKYETKKIGDVIYYKPIAFKNLKPDQIRNIKLKFEKDGLTFTEPAFGTPEWEEWSQNKKTLKDLISVEDAKVLGLKDLTTNVYPIKAGGQTFSVDTQYCTTQLADYFTKALQSTATNERLMTDQQIETYKKNIRKCKGLGMYDNFKFDEKTLNPQVTKSLKPYGFLNRRLTYKEIVKNLSDKGVFQLPESKSNQIKNLIRENINEIKATKHKRLIQEENIIGKRLSIITEGVNVKSKEQQRKISKEMFNETIYLSTQGYDKELISENLFDIFSGLFPKGVAEPIMQYFKEEAAKWLAGKLGLDPNSWMSSIIISAIGDLNIGDVSKLTDCNFVTKWLSKSIAEGVVRKIQVEKFGDNAFYNLIRNTMVEALEVTKLGTMFEESLGKIICPLVSNLSGKMEGAADVMKQKALGSA
jgi:hypothetical protein